MAANFKVLVFTPIWGRHKVVQVWHEGVKRLNSYWPEMFEFIPFGVVSNTEDVRLCDRLGIEHTIAENKPLGAKHNKGLQATKEFNYDYIIQLGSDDVIFNDYLPYLAYAMNKGVDIAGVEELYFWDCKNAKGVLFQVMNGINKVIGAGRIISRKAIEALDFTLWADGINSGLDFSSQQKLAAKGFKTEVIITSCPVVADFKTANNIWTYNHFQGQSITFEEIKKHLSANEIKAIHEVARAEN